MGMDMVWSVKCLYKTKRQTVGEFIFCPQTRVFLVVRPLYSDWDLYHWLPDSQALGFGINYTTSFPGPPAPREWWDFSASIITSVSLMINLFIHAHTRITHTELWLTHRIKPFCCFIFSYIPMFSDWKLFKVGVSKLCKQPESDGLSLCRPKEESRRLNCVVVAWEQTQTRQESVGRTCVPRTLYLQRQAAGWIP